MESFDSLSDEMIVKIFSYLQCRDLLACSRTAKRWKNIVDGNEWKSWKQWRNLCLQWGYTDRDFEETKLSTWKEMYLCHRNWRNEDFVSSKIALEIHDCEIQHLHVIGTTVFITTVKRVHIYDITGGFKNVLVIPYGLYLRNLQNIYADNFLVLNDNRGLMYVYKKTGACNFAFKYALILNDDEKESSVYPGVEHRYHISEKYCVYHSLEEIPKSKEIELNAIGFSTILADDKLMISYKNKCHIICLINDMVYGLYGPFRSAFQVDWPFYCVIISGVVKVFNILNNSVVSNMVVGVRCSKLNLSIQDKYVAFSGSEVDKKDTVLLKIWDWENKKLIYNIAEFEQPMEPGADLFHTHRFGSWNKPKKIQHFIKGDFVVLKFGHSVTVSNYVKGQKLRKFLLTECDYTYQSICNQIQFNGLLFDYLKCEIRKRIEPKHQVDVWDTFSGEILYSSGIQSGFKFAYNSRFLIKSNCYHSIEILDFGAN